MKVLIHADKGEKAAPALRDLIQDQLPEIRVQRSRNMEELRGKLGRPLNQVWVLIIYAATLEFLNGLFPVQSLFENKKLILILPGQDNQAFIRGLKLNPSYISTTENDAHNVLMVLKRISRRHRP